MADTAEGLVPGLGNEKPTTVPDPGDGTPAASSDARILTPEERDEQTIARALGTQQSQDKSDEASNADADADTDKSDDSDEDAGNENDDETENPDGDTATADTGTGADTEEALDDLTDEDIETIIDAADERILAHPRIKKMLDDRAQADADRRFAEREQQLTVTQEQEKLMEQGSKAVRAIYDLFGKAGTSLANAVAGKEFDPVVLDPEDIKKSLADFGSSIVAETRRDFDTAFGSAFREGAILTGVPFSNEDKKTVETLVKTAERIANDPEQGRAKANEYMFVESVKFLVQRARDVGESEATAKIQKQRTALKKIVGDGGENSTKAAVAKLARTRSKLAPKTPEASAEQTTPTASMESYRAAKQAGEFEKADEIMAAMARQR